MPLLIAVFVNGGVLLLLPLAGRAVGRMIHLSTPQPLVVEPFERRLLEAPKVVEEPLRHKPQKPKTEKRRLFRTMEPLKVRSVVRREREEERLVAEPLELGLTIEPHLRHLEGVGVAEGSPEGALEGGATEKDEGASFEPPVLIHSVRPKYPRWASEQGLEGTVVVRMLVTEDGRVENAEVVRSSGYGLLDDAALSAVRSYLFRPARKDGEPIKVYVEQEIIFKIER